MLIDTAKLIIETAHYVKIGVFAFFSLITGTAFAETAAFILFQAPQAVAENTNYLTPIFGGIGGILVYFATKYFDDWLARRREKEKELKALEGQHLSVSDTIAKLQHEKEERLIDEIKDVAIERIIFKAEQNKELRLAQLDRNKELKLSEFIARERSHYYGNYVNKVQGYAQVLENECKNRNIPLPYEFAFLNYPQIMDGLDVKITEYETALEKDVEERRKKIIAEFEAERDREKRNET